jgi:hypothetical protein
VKAHLSAAVAIAAVAAVLQPGGGAATASNRVVTGAQKPAAIGRIKEGPDLPSTIDDGTASAIGACTQTPTGCLNSITWVETDENGNQVTENCNSNLPNPQYQAGVYVNDVYQGATPWGCFPNKTATTTERNGIYRHDSGQWTLVANNAQTWNNQDHGTLSAFTYVCPYSTQTNTFKTYNRLFFIDLHGNSHQQDKWSYSSASGVCG